VFLNTASDEADVTSLGRPFHTYAPATGKTRPPTKVAEYRLSGTNGYLRKLGNGHQNGLEIG